MNGLSKKIVFALICLSLIIKAILILNTEIINPDGAMYINASQFFAEGEFKKGLALFSMPFYSLLIASAHFFISDWVLAAQFLSGVALLLINIPLYLIIRETFNEKAALWGVLAFTITPAINTYAADVIRDPLSLLFLSLAVYFGLKAISLHKLTDYLWVGVFSGIALLFRVEAIVFPMVFLGVLTILFIKNRDERLVIRKGFLCFSVVPAGVLLLFLFLLIWGGLSIGRVDFLMEHVEKIWSLSFLDNYHRLYDFMKVAESEWPGYNGNQNFFEVSRHYIFLIYLIGAIEIYLSAVTVFFFLPLIIGFLSFGKCNRKHLLLVLVATAFAGAAYYRMIEFDFTVKRFYLVSLLFTFPWIGLGLQSIWTFLNKKDSTKKLFLALFCFVFLVLPIWRTFSGLSSEKISIKVAGEWLGSQESLIDSNILTSDLRVPFYAGLSSNAVTFPLGLNEKFTLETMEKSAHKNEVDLIVLRVSDDDKSPEFNQFSVIKEFSDKKSLVLIYRKDP